MAIGVLGLGVLVLLSVCGLELGFAMVATGFLGFAYLRSPEAAFNLMAKEFYDAFASYTFTVLPLFILMGQLAFNSGIADQLYKSARKFLGHIPGGLAIATVVGAALFKAMCGSAIATSATFASVAVPEMDKLGYNRKLSTGVAASVGALGNLIPPAAILIVLGMLTQQSIGKLFLAGIVPGAIVATLFIAVIFGWCKLNPVLGPVAPRCGWRERMSGLPEIVAPLVIFVIAVGGLIFGLFTPTEAGSAGTAAVICLVLGKRKLDLSGLWKSVKESLGIACMVSLLIAGSFILGRFIAVTKIPMLMSDWVVSLPLPPEVTMCVIIGIYLLGGSVLDDVAFMVLATPIFYPSVIKLGFDPIWFCIVLAVTIGIGVLVPPVAVAVFIVKGITGESMGLVYRGAAPFLLSLVACLVLLFIFPSLVTYLPNVLMQ
ncbi:MAG: TRAP transporter large permease [Deltaproteobacteria bacterium]|nr:TRAP transporter large permease [Deltaproteobacteria bacterium]